MSLWHRTRARRHAWWCVAVFVLGMLAPGISVALAHVRSDFSAWQDVCRAPSASSATQKPKPIETTLDLLAKGHDPNDLSMDWWTARQRCYRSAVIERICDQC